MRRPLAVVLPLLVLASAVSAVKVASPAGGQVGLPENPGRGVVLAGLKRSPNAGVCRGKYELLNNRTRVAGGTRALCTHGPDPAPEGVDVRTRRAPEPTPSNQAGAATDGAAGAGTGSIPCYGTGSDGFRVQVIYARASVVDVTDRYSQFASSLVQWTGAVDGVVSASAAETGGTRHVRFLTDASCSLAISRVTLSPTGDDNFSNTIAELRGWASTAPTGSTSSTRTPTCTAVLPRCTTTTGATARRA